MLNRTKKSNSEGFTIIEVMIVLAIAGLILLIVFLAVPALQRSSRNTQRKSDIQRIVGAITEDSTNKNGKIPTSQAALDSAVGNTKLAYYTAATPVTWKSGAAAVANPKDDTVVYVSGASCNANGIDAQTGTARQFAVLYTIETSGAYAGACIDS